MAMILLALGLIGCQGVAAVPYFPNNNSTASKLSTGGITSISSLVSSTSNSTNSQSSSFSSTIVEATAHSSLKPYQSAVNSSNAYPVGQSSTSYESSSIPPSWGTSQSTTHQASPVVYNGTTSSQYNTSISLSSSNYSASYGTAGLVPWPPEFKPKDWSHDYLRSDQCTSDAMIWYNITAIPTYNRKRYTFTVPAGTVYTTRIRPDKYNHRDLTITGPTSTIYTEPNEANYDGPIGACCGGCQITNWYVDMMYWPQTGADSRCLTWPTPTKSRSSIPWPTKTPDNTGNIEIPHPTEDYIDHPAVTPRALQPTLVKRGLSNGTDEHMHIAVEDGFTYTSPYVYMKYSSIWAEDKCGPHGGLYTSLTWSFLPEQVSSIDKGRGETMRFNLTELPCGPKGYNTTDGRYYPATVAPAPQLTLLDPTWKNCFIGYWQNLDPPFAFSEKGDFFDPTTAEPVPTSLPASPHSAIESYPQPTAESMTIDSPFQPGPSVPRPADPSSPPTSDWSISLVNKPPSRPTVTVISQPAQTPIVVGSQTASFDPVASVVHIGSSEIKPGNDPVTIADVPISVVPSGLNVIVGSSTQEIPPPPEAPAVTAGGQTLQSSNGQFQVGTQTVQPGAPAITISNTPISIAPGGSSAVIGSSTINLGASPSFATPVLIAGQTLAPSNGNFILGGKTLLPGGPAQTVDNEVVSIAADGTNALVGSSTIPLNQIVAPSQGVFGGTTLTREGDNFVLVGHAIDGDKILDSTHTIWPGAPARTIDGQPVSVTRDGSFAIIGSETLTIPPQPAPTPLVVDGQTLTPSGSVYIVGDSTIAPGSSAITISGTPISLEKYGPSIYVSSGSYPLPTPDPAKTFEAGGQTFTSGSSEVVVADETLRPGDHAITVSGTRISLGMDSTASNEIIVIGSKTFDIEPPKHTAPPVHTIGGAEVTLLPSGAGVVFGGKTYTPGQSFTVSETILAVEEGIVVIKATSTTMAKTSSKEDVGSYVMNGIKGADRVTGVVALASAKTTGGSAGQTEAPAGNDAVRGVRLSMWSGLVVGMMVWLGW